MKRRHMLVATCSAIALLQTVASASLVSVNNASFESPAVGDGSWSNGADDWLGSSFGIQDWTDSDYTGSTGNTQDIPGADGNQGIWINSGGYCYQDVGALAANTTYTLTVAVGNRASKSYDTSLIQLAFYQDSYGGTLLGSSGSLGGTASAGGNHVDVAYQFVTGASVSGNLVIALEQTGASQANVDNVRLEAIPEPATLGLVGIFGVGLMVARRRMKR